MEKQKPNICACGLTVAFLKTAINDLLNDLDDYGTRGIPISDEKSKAEAKRLLKGDIDDVENSINGIKSNCGVSMSRIKDKLNDTVDSYFKDELNEKELSQGILELERRLDMDFLQCAAEE